MNGCVTDILIIARIMYVGKFECVYKEFTYKTWYYVDVCFTS